MTDISSTALPRTLSPSLFLFTIIYGGMVVLAGVLGNKQVALGAGLAVEDQEVVMLVRVHRLGEDQAAAARRLERSDAYDVHDPRLITITNDGPVDDAARTLVTALAMSRSVPAARLRA